MKKRTNFLFDIRERQGGGGGVLEFLDNLPLVIGSCVYGVCLEKREFEGMDSFGDRNEKYQIQTL